MSEGYSGKRAAATTKMEVSLPANMIVFMARFTSGVPQQRSHGAPRGLPKHAACQVRSPATEDEAPPANTVAFMATPYRRRTAVAEPLATDVPP